MSASIRTHAHTYLLIFKGRGAGEKFWEKYGRNKRDADVSRLQDAPCNLGLSRLWREGGIHFPVLRSRPETAPPTQYNTITGMSAPGAGSEDHKTTGQVPELQSGSHRPPLLQFLNNTVQIQFLSFIWNIFFLFTNKQKSYKFFLD